MHPEQFAGRSINRDCGPARPGGGVEHSVDHERRAFQFVLRTIAEHIGLQAPGHFEVIEIGGIDLIKRPVAGAGKISGVSGPFRFLRVILAVSFQRNPRQNGNKEGEQNQPRVAVRIRLPF